MKGYAGQILQVDLAKGKLRTSSFESGFAKKFLGGRGFCADIIYKGVEPRTDPLSPENILVFAVGPLSGTVAPASGRYIVAGKSPLTGVYGFANSGG
ncbi:MAG TPA: aldehyde ferredoxin oxidoreductase N-terminal domain-containing protein, partial [Candidatus Bathyarchaeia archaeon]|nr:aldehyde ferredoxin oxidoreductase N-terminal domain-containing protein [Candidatus Bathyarchaeia archaeon]